VKTDKTGYLLNLVLPGPIIKATLIPSETNNNRDCHSTHLQARDICQQWQ